MHRTWLRGVLIGVSMLLLSGACGAPMRYHATATTKYPAKPPDCPLATGASHPGPGYEEIGIISIGGNYYQDPTAFTQAMRPEVCAAGGDLIVTEVNGYGSISRGIVFRKRAGAPVASTPPNDPSVTQTDNPR